MFGSVHVLAAVKSAFVIVPSIILVELMLLIANWLLPTAPFAILILVTPPSAIPPDAAFAVT